MTTISAKTILRSRHARRPEKVLSTLLLRYPRFIHAEVMTHRAFSRNAASSRAIPFEKQVAAMRDDPAVPLWWGAEQKGMQAAGEVNDARKLAAEKAWHEAMERAVDSATWMHNIGLHKQIVNRIIEPFTHITVLVSATEWDNFLELRDHPDAEPHIQLLARAVRTCLNDPAQTLQPGEWHLPFVNVTNNQGESSLPHEVSGPALDNAIRLTVGRCASTSYKTVDGFDMTLERATALHDRFVNSRPQHASPLEHVACADRWLTSDHREEPAARWESPEQHANFDGFRQYRHML